MGVKAVLKTSYIICTKNRIDDIKRLFETIKIQTYIPDEIIIVDSSDNNKTESFIEEIRESYKSRICYYKSIPGLTLQRNFGVSKAEGDIVFFTDDDGLLDKNYFSEIMKCYEDDSVMGVGSRETNNIVRSRISSFLRNIFMLSRADGNGKMQPSGFPAYMDMSNKDHVAEAEILGGFCSFRRKVFDDFKFDENLVGYAFMEDVDFSYRVSRKYKLMYNPYAEFYHNVSDTERIDQRKYFFMTIYNHFYLTKKNMGITFFRIVPVIWSYIGVFVRAGLISIYYHETKPLYGFFEGLIMIMRNPLGRKNSI